MAIEKVNLAHKFSLFRDHWSPKIAGEINDFAVKLVKLKGEFVWHHHDKEDVLFMVVKGCLKIKLRDGEIVLNEGEFVNSRQYRYRNVAQHTFGRYQKSESPVF
jgi:mannose-6-phosphate isomerase-like protein (cupin superfamily)